MRSYYCLILLITLAVLFGQAAGAARGVRVLARQDEEASSTAVRASPSSSIAPKTTTTRNTASRGTVSATAEPSSPSESSSEKLSQSSAPSSVRSNSASNIAATVTSASSTSTTVSPTSAADQDGELPINPRITPAIGLAGAVLLISGVAYCLMGIRMRWLYIFLSTVYLTSICIMVLIVYVMHPPVSDGLQGGYLVGILVPALLLGGFSVIFQEITEGLCCALGGFCLSMWFLTLKDGGLIESSVGKIIFVLCFMVPIFILSFSHYTRTYASIGSIAFSGATATVLGIDCFSRAGLKEFWLYIWGLNDNIFPLYTFTYPMTRGIKVEIAAIILLSIVGGISQSKIWQVIETHRKAKAERDAEQDRHLERIEADIGRRVEDVNARERAQWEAVYGDKQATSPKVSTASERSLPKKRASVITRELSRSETSESIEMNNMSRSNSEKPLPVVITRSSASNHDEIQQIDMNGQPLPSIEYHESTVTQGEQGEQDRRLTESNDQVVLKRKSLSPPQPQVVPLPIPLPRQDSMDDDAGSGSTVQQGNESIKRKSQRLSSTGRRLSGLHNSFKASSQLGDERPTSPISLATSESQEALVIEDDRASSVIATLDERDSRSRLSFTTWSRHASMTLDQIDIGGQVLDLEDGERTPTSMTPAGDQRKSIALSDVNASNVANQDDHQISTRMASSQRPAVEKRKDSGAADGQQDDTPSSSKSSSKPESNGSGISGLEEGLVMKLASKPSKVAQIYRTNEWAKHAASAEIPDLEEIEIEEPGSPGVRVEHGTIEEAAPVRVDELLQTTPAPGAFNRASVDGMRLSLDQTRLSMAPRRISGSPSAGVEFHQEAASSNRTSTNPYGQMGRAYRPNPIQTRMSVDGLPRAAITRNSSGPLTGVSSSFPSPVINQIGSGLASRQSHMNGAQRSTSMPLGEQPMDEVNDAAAMGPRQSTLLQQRESFLRGRMASIGFHSPSSTPVITSQDDRASVRALSLHEAAVNPDDMSLADRRAYLQLQQQAWQNRPPSVVNVNGVAKAWPVAQNFNDFNSHQPQRVVTVNHIEKADQYAKWRQSQQETPSPGKQMVADESRRMVMIAERRQRESIQQAKQEERSRWVNQMDQEMRKPHMHQLHKEAMSRMQAKANRAAQ